LIIGSETNNISTICAAVIPYITTAFQMQVNVTDNASATAVFLNPWVEQLFYGGVPKKINESAYY